MEISSGAEREPKPDPVAMNSEHGQTDLAANRYSLTDLAGAKQHHVLTSR
jgi:hypothetical protein